MVYVYRTSRLFTAAGMARIYGQRVIYYGKPMSQAEVLRDKLRYIAVWPDRHYRIVLGTASAACGPDGTACQVSGTEQWNRRSRTGKVSIGRARLVLVLSANRHKVIRESAVILREHA
jgi:hypothetical protein